MKELSFDAVGVLIILLPGFLAARMVQALVIRRKQTEFDKVIEALVYSLIVYTVYSTVSVQFPIDWSTPKDAAGVQHYLIQLHSRELWKFFGISASLALLFALLENHDITGKVLRTLRISKRTSRASVWLDTFQDNRGNVQVELKDGRHVIGWVLRYSGSPDDSTLYLCNAYWFVPETGETIGIPGDGILLTKETGIRYVMFLDKRDGEELEASESTPTASLADHR